ncbi:MAG: alkaline phosphatase [Acidobacteriota bacterium]|jgi:alkaline phosphatase|nr:alkaline phosphatase [Acidobacteriota bacterium]
MKNKFFGDKKFTILIIFGSVVSLIFFPLKAALQTSNDTSKPFPIRRQESPETWRRGGEAAIERIKNAKKFNKRAKNVILFVGDGMGITTLTASRILEGQLRGESGEENSLSFEQFPNVALSKTYSVNQQTSDSAPTMSAIISGIKTDEGIISVNQNVVVGDYRTVKGNEAKTFLEMAEENGKSTGVVTTARLTHATPAACYAHSPHRDWEADVNLSADARQNNFPDIARQLIEFPYGDGLEVALGGGRTKFVSNKTIDLEYPDKKGERLDGRDLPKEWTTKYKNSAYVWNKQQFDSIDAKKTKHLLGLFEASHLQYEFDRKSDKSGEPSLSEMTSKAIDLLSQNKKGYFLMVEAGRIDHAHHDGNAFRALTDTIELSSAVRTALSKVDLEDTLLIVTADHSHTFTMAGYPIRGNNILGLVREVGGQGLVEEKFANDKNNQPFTTLGYANGTGNRGGTRPNLTQESVLNPNYKQEATVPLSAETHGGEDVAIFANGAGSHLVQGVMEENWIFYVMKEAMRMK